MTTKQKIFISLLTAGCLAIGSFGLVACNNGNNNSGNNNDNNTEVGGDNTTGGTEGGNQGGEAVTTPTLSVGTTSVTFGDSASAVEFTAPADGTYAITTSTADLNLDNGYSWSDTENYVSYLNTDSGDAEVNVLVSYLTLTANQKVTMYGTSTTYSEKEFAITIYQNAIKADMNNDTTIAIAEDYQTIDYTFVAAEDGQYKLSIGMTGTNIYVEAENESDAIIVLNPADSSNDLEEYTFNLKAGEKKVFTCGTYTQKADTYTLHLEKTGEYAGETVDQTPVITLGEATQITTTNGTYNANITIAEAGTYKVTIVNGNGNLMADYNVMIGSRQEGNAQAVNVDHTTTDAVTFTNQLNAGTYPVYIQGGALVTVEENGEEPSYTTFNADATQEYSFTITIEKVA